MDTKKMRACSPLLPDPGGEVVRECLDEIERLREALRHAAAALDEAAVDLGEWGAYADEYTRKKHALCDDVKYYERAASAARGMVTPNV